MKKCSMILLALSFVYSAHAHPHHEHENILQMIEHWHLSAWVSFLAVLLVTGIALTWSRLLDQTRRAKSKADKQR